MPGLTKSEKERFEKFLASLPPERKKALYSRFRQMDDEERNEAIRKIMSKTGSGAPQKVQSPQKPKPRQGQPQGKPQQRPKTAPKVKPSSKPESGRKPVPKSQTPAKQTGKPVDRKPSEEVSKPKAAADTPAQKKPNFNRIVNVLTILVLIGCLFTLALTYLTNREDIDRLFVKEEPAATTETDATGDDTDVTAASSETGSGSDTETSASSTNDPAVPTPSPTDVPLKNDAPDLTGFSIVIDPMHQAETSETTESLMPDKEAFKASATAGGKGVKTGIAESELVLNYALCVKEYLEKCGAKVVLTRTVNDIDLSNQDRARIATSSDCDIYLRLEAKCADDPALTGVRVCIPEYSKSKTKDFSTGQDLCEAIAEAEGLENGGAATSMAYTGLNYATSVHAFQLNLGFLSNEIDEQILVDSGNIYEVAASLAEFCKTIK